MESQNVESRLEIFVPISAPTRIPGAIAPTTFHITAPRLWCARTDDNEVNMIVARDVAIATCTICASGIPTDPKSIVRNGVMIMPPPIPNRPARKPVQLPSSNKPKTIEMDIVKMYK